MDLKLVRTDILKDKTFGKLYINDDYICDTLEPPYFDTDESNYEAHIIYTKIGNTAIPTGTYDIDMNTISPKFKDREWGKRYDGIVPWINGVKGFIRVLIHVGNYASQFKKSDTNGCVLVGTADKTKGVLVASTKAYCRLMDVFLLKAKEKGEKITIRVCVP